VSGRGARHSFFPSPRSALWDELAMVCPRGVLTSADRWRIELACQLMLKSRTVGLIPQYGMTGAGPVAARGLPQPHGHDPRRSIKSWHHKENEKLDEPAQLAAGSNSPVSGLSSRTEARLLRPRNINRWPSGLPSGNG
jgi:hypothetical protein